MIDPQTLASLPLFSSAPRIVLDVLAPRARIVEFAPDERIFSAGERAHGIYVILFGSVRVIRATDGRQHVVHSEGAGGTLGEVPVFDGGGYPATAVAAEPTRCLLLDREALLQAMSASPEVALVFLGRLASRVRTLVERLDSRSSRSVPSRLSEFLLGRKQAARSRTISLGMTQSELAEELGTVREVVVRGLRTLTVQGLIAPAGGGRYEILDREGLAVVANTPGDSTVQGPK
jgi:CRP/FNR family transcriptional regulator, dissimilatory nitrate respiration regulator